MGKIATKGRPKKSWEDYPTPILDEITGCLRWQGPHNPDGYGEFSTKAAHRTAYEKAYGPVPEGLVIDHVYTRGCRYRDCVNPEHLEAITHGENIHRGHLAKPERTHCKYGHEFEKVGWKPLISKNGTITKVCVLCTQLRSIDSSFVRKYRAVSVKEWGK